METKSYTNREKFTKELLLPWPKGEWDNEPDKMQYQDEQTGLPCLIVRNYSGGLCGYVGVDKRHPFYQKRYDEVYVSVHGGLTFSDFCMPNKDESTGICHVPSKNEPHKVWWLGFDCVHLGDASPGMMAVSLGIGLSIREYEVYRNIDYVKSEISQLAKQIKLAGRSIAEINRFRKLRKPKCKRK